MQNYKLTVAYDGTDYHGFQIQVNAPTVQEHLEKALGLLYGKKTRVHPAGRTDAGVHARGQVVSFNAPPRVPSERLPAALRGILPRDILAVKGEEAAHSFHARFSARGKRYCYRIDRGPVPNVFWQRYAWHIPDVLDLDKMRKASVSFLGHRDFAAFQAAGRRVKNSVRTLKRLEIVEEDEVLTMVFEADGFLYKMVRNIVGTLVQIGLGRISPEGIREILDRGQRIFAGPTAPPHGLCLEEVYYPDS